MSFSNLGNFTNISSNMEILPNMVLLFRISFCTANVTNDEWKKLSDDCTHLMYIILIRSSISSSFSFSNYKFWKVTSSLIVKVIIAKYILSNFNRNMMERNIKQKGSLNLRILFVMCWSTVLQSFHSYINFSFISNI